MALYLPHEERVLDEYRELYEKLTKLDQFTRTPTYASLTQPERHLLVAQVHAMRTYAQILHMRIQLFDQAAATRAPYSS